MVQAQRWKDEATYVQPPLIETGMVTLFANTFKFLYYEHLMGSSSQHFYNVVCIAERIEQGIKSGHIAELVEKKGFARKKRESDMSNLKDMCKGKKANYLTLKLPILILSNLLPRIKPNNQITRTTSKDKTQEIPQNNYHLYICP